MKFSRNNVTLFLLVVVASCIAALGFSKAVINARAFSYARVTSPFKLESTKSMYSADSKLFMKKNKVYSHFTDGSVSFVVTEVFPSTKPIVWEILDVPSGTRSFLDPLTQSVTTLRRSSKEMDTMVSQLEAEGCPTGVDLAKLMPGPEMFGRKTVRYLDKPLAGVTDEMLIVPELNCLIVKESERNEATSSYNEQVAISLTVGELSPNGERVPAGYIERSPKEVERLHANVIVGDRFWGPRLLNQMERQYSENH